MYTKLFYIHRYHQRQDVVRIEQDRIESFTRSLVIANCMGYSIRYNNELIRMFHPYIRLLTLYVQPMY